MRTLQFVSTAQLIKVPANAVLSRRVVDGFVVRESTSIESRDPLPDGTVRYFLLVEKEISSNHEVPRHNANIIDLINELEKIWIYAAGMPFNAPYLKLSTSIPIGWDSNSLEVQNAFNLENNGLSIGGICIKSRHWIESDEYPLKRAIGALDAYRKAGPEIRALIDLHYLALLASHEQGRIFLLAKALELVRKILTKNDNLKEMYSKLSKEVRDRLRRPLKWSYTISNRRFDIRHPARRHRGLLELYRATTAEEKTDFEHDADTILRGVIADNLNIEYIFVESKC